MRALAAGAITLVGRVKETLSVPAPRSRVRSRAGVVHYRATTPATPGAPPRKLSGRLRASQGYSVSPSTLTARIGSNLIYAGWEYRGHPYLAPTLAAHRQEIATAMERALLAP